MGLDDFVDFASDVGDFAEAAFDVASETLSDGFEFLSDGFDQLQEQVGSFAGESSWFDSNFLGDIVPTDITTLSDSFNLDSLSSFTSELPSFSSLTSSLPSIDSLTSGLPSLPSSFPSLSSIIDRVPSANSLISSTVTQVSSVATRTVSGLVTQVQNTAVNVARNTANQALSTVVGPAAAATITSGVTRSLTGPATTSARTVSPNTDPTAPPVGPTLPAGQVDESASNVGYITVQNPEDGTYYVKNEDTGAIVATGLTEQQAILTAQDQTFIDSGAATDPDLATQPANAGSVATNASNNAPVSDPNVNGPPISLGDPVAIAAAAASNAANTALADAAARTTALIAQAQRQQTVRAQRQNQAQAGDWRVRLRLAPTSNYLYNAPDCGQVLWPLRNTDGVIFPYTPSIDTSYKANYSAYDLTHSNYRGYFYQNSYVDGINIKATFTAQDTAEANYLLAVIHFFRSVTKMFYGQDAERGSPPPLTYLSGLGDFQFNEHPCVVSQFNYNLPADVNYIRAQSVLVNGTNLTSARRRQTVLGNPLSYAIQRLSTLGQGIQPGAVDAPFAVQGSLGAKNPTYVPTKMDISLTLLPIQSRSQVSQLFSLKGFANGNLLKGGFW
jgi:hypothetical protein